MSLRDVRDRALDYLGFRKQSYLAVFNPASEATRYVLEDLARFCRAHRTTVGKTPEQTLVLEGRREVWLRIQNHLNLTDEQLYELFK